ncbi:MAG: DUF6261 family protein [Tannerella sp.]|jgi:hypothetical protein|nr:DUF6261 family protein [Tannerella sp.]
MKKLLNAHLQIFRNEEHCEYLVLFRGLILQFKTVEDLVAALYPVFTDLLDREEDLIDAMHKSSYTKLIAEAAYRVDRTLVGMRGVIVAALHHFVPATVEAAQRLFDRFDSFGRIIKKAYEAEALDVNLLIKDLQGEYATDVTTVGLTTWLAELQAAEAAFELLLKERNAESAHKPQDQLRRLRQEIDVVYHRMTDRINAAATLDDAGAYYEFVDLLNAEITYFNNHTHRHARKDLSVAEACVIEPLELQPYTGKAITPVPAAHYREEGKPTVELVFAKDFFVTYKNNVDVGMADLVIHGKGAYRGQKKTTFAIARKP